MKHFLLLVALGVCACDREAPSSPPAVGPVALDNAVPAGAGGSQKEKMLPLPKDAAQLDRMILAGYTPHGDHLHPPGVKECPLAQGSDAVM